MDITDPANLAAVIAAINALGPTDATDYDAALATAQQGIMDPSWLGTTATTKGLVYFFSDGVPENDVPPDTNSSYPGGSKDNSLNQTEENIWEGRNVAAGFATGLADKGVVSIAVGLGAQIAGDVAALAQLGRVAYYNETFQDDPVIVVSDENQLIAEIIQTVPATVTGNVLTNDDPGKDGFGNPTITGVSAVIDADTTSELVTVTATGYKVETNNGVLLIDKMTGDFSYTAAPGGSGHTDTFNYTIQDGFLGDTASSTITVTITPPTMVTGSAPFDATDGNNFIIGDDANNTINAHGGHRFRAGRLRQRPGGRRRRQRCALRPGGQGHPQRRRRQRRPVRRQSRRRAERWRRHRRACRRHGQRRAGRRRRHRYRHPQRRCRRGHAGLARRRRHLWRRRGLVQCQDRRRPAMCSMPAARPASTSPRSTTARSRMSRPSA